MTRASRPSPLFFLALALVLGVLLVLAAQGKHHTVEQFRNAQPFFAEISHSPATDLNEPDAIDIPVLVYHIVRPLSLEDSDAVRALAQTPEVFDHQLQHLTDAHYTVISFTDLEDHFLKGTFLPKKPIIISFDDGWKSQFTYAFPILQKHRMLATFFVFTNPIGRKGFMSWDNLATLRDAGMTLASHTLSHPFLAKISPEELVREVEESKTVLEQKLGVSVRQFAYPFGQYNATVEDAVRAAGYRSARGDAYSGTQSRKSLYHLSAINVPTTVEAFVRRYP